MNPLQAILTKAQTVSSSLGRVGINNLKLVWMGILGIVLIMTGSFFSTPDVPQAAKPLSPVPLNVDLSRSYEEVLESKLANLLSQVHGAGMVAVNITLDLGSSQDYAKNIVRESKTIQEKDTTGGARSTTETKDSETILVSKENGIDRPVVMREQKPTIKGVLVVAEGAGNSQVKSKLTQAVATSLGIPVYKITVLPQRK